MSVRTDDAAVSEIVGALMLVLVVSSAAFGFGLFLHKQAKETEAQKAAEQAKRLEVVSVPRIHPDDSLAPDSDWDTLDLTLLSEHLHDSVIRQLVVNGMAVKSVEFAPFDGSNVLSFDPLDPDYGELQVAPRQQVVVRLMDVDGGASFFAPAAPIAKSDPIEVELVTDLGNHVERAFSPPSAVIVLDQQGTGATSFILDGSRSETQNEGGFLTRFQWTVTPAASDPDAPGPYTYNGRRALASVICDDTECDGTVAYTITLAVTDNFDMVGMATYTVAL
jgi:hypothetical protein